MQSDAIRTLSKEEIDFILEEESNLITTKQRKKLQRMRNRRSQNNNNNQQEQSRVTNIEDHKKKIKTKLEAKTDKQQQLINTIIQKEQTVVIGSAGTGKTYVTAAMAILALKEKKVDKIVLTRPNVSTGRSLGYFPGSLEEKMSPWVAPVMSVFKEFMSPSVLEYELKSGRIEIVPFEVIRGRSFGNAFIILDEAQNTTRDEMKAFVTRVGEDSKLVIDGDIIQTDIGKDNGLSWALNNVKRHKYLRENVGIIEFTSEDVVRSGLCKAWVECIEGESRKW